MSKNFHHESVLDEPRDVVVVSRLRLDCERDHLRASGGGNRGVAPLRKHIKLLLTYDYFATKKHGKKAE